MQSILMDRTFERRKRRERGDVSKSLSFVLISLLTPGKKEKERERSRLEEKGKNKYSTNKNMQWNVVVLCPLLDVKNCILKPHTNLR